VVVQCQAFGTRGARAALDVAVEFGPYSLNEHFLAANQACHLREGEPIGTSRPAVSGASSSGRSSAPAEPDHRPLLVS